MVEVKKLPSGEAYGARDLQYWAGNRMKGGCGSYSRKAEKEEHQKVEDLSRSAGRRVKGFDGYKPNLKELKKKEKKKRNKYQKRAIKAYYDKKKYDQKQVVMRLRECCSQHLFWVSLSETQQDNLVWDLVVAVEK